MLLFMFGNTIPIVPDKPIIGILEGKDVCAYNATGQECEAVNLYDVPHGVYVTFKFSLRVDQVQQALLYYAVLAAARSMDVKV